MSLIKVPIIGFLIIISGCSGSSSEHRDHKHNDSVNLKSDTSKKSIPAEVSKRVGNTDIKINYHSPRVRGRVIWGGLVPYDQVWVTGAHKATTFEVGKDFLLGGKTISAGKYGLFTIPGRTEWTVILNKNWDQHLADDYRETEDVVRVNVTPDTLTENVERLKYEIDQRGDRIADIIISWEKLRIIFFIELI